MALLDISLVTRALVELLKAHIGHSPAWPFGAWGAPSVTAQPPDLLSAGSLGVYLYHVTEEAHTKNQVPSGRDTPPVRFTPMGLCLYYQISALGSGTGEQIALQEQILVGCAVKALHDYPAVDDNTSVPRRAPQTPLDVLKSVGLDGDDNRLRITMQPIAYHEASSFWNAASLVPRLAVYYQVSVVLLEPEKPSSVSGRVYQYGIQTFVGGAPRLDGSENTVTVQVPTLPAQTLVARPAEVPVGGALTFTGFNLAGDATRLVLQNFLWPARVEADANWGVIATGDKVFATVQEEADGNPIIPGVYTARMKVIRRRTMPDGSLREFGTLSNDTPFTISARIDSLAFAADIGTIKGYHFAPLTPATLPFPPDAVQISIAGSMLTQVPSSPPPIAPNPGEFWIVDPRTLMFRLPAGLVTGTPVSLRLFVMGAESPTTWFTP